MFPAAVNPCGVFVANETFNSGRSFSKTPLSASLHLIGLHRGTHFEQVPSEPLCNHTHTHTAVLFFLDSLLLSL